MTYSAAARRNLPSTAWNERVPLDSNEPMRGRFATVSEILLGRFCAAVATEWPSNVTSMLLLGGVCSDLPTHDTNALWLARSRSSQLSRRRLPRWPTREA